MKKGKFLSRLIMVLALCLVFVLPIAIVGCDNDGAKQIQITLSYGYSSVPNSTETIDQNSQGSILDQYVPSREGYTFVGWSTVEGSKKHIVKSDDILDTSMTLYAIWERQQLTITYNLNGYEGDYVVEPQIVGYGETVTVRDISDIYRENYTFDGWYRNAVGSGERVTTITVNSNITLYAKWKGDNRTAKFYKYDFANNGGYELDNGATRTYEYGANVVLPLSNVNNDILSLYDFLGWKKDTPTGKLTSANTIEDVTYQASKSYAIDWAESEVVLYPVWRNKDFVMSYTNAEGQVIEITKQYSEGVKFTIPDEINKTGYIFKGWSDGNTTYTAGQEVDANKNYSLTPVYEGKPATITINYSDVNGEPAQQTISKKFGDTLNLNELVSQYINSDRYVFDGWYDNADYTGEALGTSVVLDEAFFGTGKETYTKELYAKTSLTVNKVSFTFNGEELFSREVSYGQNLEFVITDEEKALITGALQEGYEVTELIYNEENYGLTETINFTNVINPVNVVINVVPKGYNVIYVIGYDGQGKEITQSETHKFGSKVTLRTDIFEMVGYNFIGWQYEGGEQILNNTIESMPANNVKVYPVYTIFAYEEIKNLDDVTIGVGITGIVDGAVVEETVTIPQTIFSYNVIKISANAFKNNTSIKNIIIPNTITTIEESAFAGTTALKYVIVPEQNNISVIGNNAFDGSSIQAFNTKAESVGEFSFELIDDATIGNEAFARTKFTMVNINALKDSLLIENKIGTGLFKENTALKTVTLNLVPNLTDNMFDGCTSLANVSLYNTNLTHFGKYAFRNTALTYLSWDETDGSTLIFSDNVAYIDEGAFFGIKTLEYVYFSGSITEIKAHAFEECTNLVGIDFMRTQDEEYTTKINRIGEYAFFKTGLVNVALDNMYDDKTTIVEAYAFAEISTLNEVVFGNDLGTSGLNGWTLKENSFANSGINNTNEGDKQGKIILTKWNCENANLTIETNAFTENNYIIEITNGTMEG